jgi:hypothetical protein
VISFTDGPADGVTLALRTAPVFLRVTRSTSGKWDALDLRDDVAKPSETIFVYARVGEASGVRICARGRGGSAIRGWWANATYQHVPGVEGELVRSNAAWQRWVYSRLFSRGAR